MSADTTDSPHTFLPAWQFITFLGWTSCYQVPHHPHHSQSHDAGYAEDHAHQAIVEARCVPSNPGVVKGWSDGQGIHAQSHADVCYGQVHCQQLRSFEHGEPTGCTEQDSCIPKDGQDGCRKMIEGEREREREAYLKTHPCREVCRFKLSLCKLAVTPWTTNDQSNPLSPDGGEYHASVSLFFLLFNNIHVWLCSWNFSSECDRTRDVRRHSVRSEKLCI